jgi:hypothetical protein
LDHLEREEPDEEQEAAARGDDQQQADPLTVAEAHRPNS